MSRPLFPSRQRLALLAVLVAALAACLNGCATPNTDDSDSELPWNTPQSWEGAPMIPGLDRQ